MIARGIKLVNIYRDGCLEASCVVDDRAVDVDAIDALAVQLGNINIVVSDVVYIAIGAELYARMMRVSEGI